MVLTSLMASSYLLSVLTSSRRLQDSMIKNRQELINSQLENVYNYLRKDDHKKACKEASNAINLIDANINDLKIIEPQHNWIEIKSALIAIPIKYCEE